MSKKKEEFLKDLSYAIGKFDWGKSSLDARAIRILNTYEDDLKQLLAEQREEIVRDLEEFDKRLDSYVNHTIREHSVDAALIAQNIQSDFDNELISKYKTNNEK